MRIQILNSIWSRVLEDKDDLYTFFSYPVERWIRRGPRRERIVYYKSMVGNTGYFFTGLVPLIKGGFPEAEIQGFPKTNKTYTFPDKLGPIVLEDYQKLVIRACLNKKRGVAQSPTASGKTVIAAGILVALNARSLIIVRSKDLMYQIQEVLQATTGFKVGIVGDGKNGPKFITVGMIQTLALWDKDKLQGVFPVTSIIVDEAHHAQADTYVQTLRLIKCPFRIGLTATPKERLDDPEGYLRVTGILGPIIYRVNIEETTKRLACPILKMFSYTKNSISREAEWAECYALGIVENIPRNQKIIRIARAYARKGKSVLIVVKLIKHGENLQKLSPEIPFIQGIDDADTRREAKTFLEKRRRIVISTHIFGEGVDIPGLDVLINAAGGLSKIATIQRAGRVLRRTGSKEFGTIVDFWDMDHYILRKHSRQRYKSYKEVLKVVEE